MIEMRPARVTAREWNDIGTLETIAAQVTAGGQTATIIVNTARYGRPLDRLLDDHLAEVEWRTSVPPTGPTPLRMAEVGFCGSDRTFRGLAACLYSIPWGLYLVVLHDPPSGAWDILQARELAEFRFLAPWEAQP